MRGACGIDDFVLSPLFTLDARRKRIMTVTMLHGSNLEKSTSMDVRTPILVVVCSLAQSLDWQKDVARFVLWAGNGKLRE